MTPSQIQTVVSQLSSSECEQVLYDWNIWARDKQLIPPGNWNTWLILAGRGFGKTRTGAEAAKDEITSGRSARLALVGPTAADVRDVMIEGESGILATAHPGFRPVYHRSKRKVEWPNGAVAFAYSAEEPERLRGPQHDWAWCDEYAAWKYLETMDMLEFGLRLGENPRKVVTTTPKPLRSLIDMMNAETTSVTTGSTFENQANLAQAFFDTVVGKYQGTNLGQQELYAKILEDVEGALWTRAMIDSNRYKTEFTDKGPVLPEMRRIVVAVDPSVKAIPDRKSDECGIVVAGVGVDGIGYVLDDKTLRASPSQWAQCAVNAYHESSADRLVAEVNNGGGLVEHTIRTVKNGREVSYKQVHASKGKITRAEPIAALYEQGRVKHIGNFPELEGEMCTYDASSGQKSPNRLDAMVWAFSELMLGKHIRTDIGPRGATGTSNWR